MRREGGQEAKGLEGNGDSGVAKTMQPKKKPNSTNVRANTQVSMEASSQQASATPEVTNPCSYFLNIKCSQETWIHTTLEKSACQKQKCGGQCK